MHAHLPASPGFDSIRQRQPGDGFPCHHARQIASFCSYVRPACAGLDDGSTVVE